MDKQKAAVNSNIYMYIHVSKFLLMKDDCSLLTSIAPLVSSLAVLYIIVFHRHLVSTLSVTES